jgi:hypothetical protein
MSTNSKQTRQQGSVKLRLTTGMTSKRGTGPRTAIGKERSKYNALKHGLFSNVVVLDHETRSEFEAVLCGLRLDLKPEGLLEDALVEKIATILWRYRRLLQAESADVQKNMETEQYGEDQLQSPKLELGNLPVPVPEEPPLQTSEDGLRRADVRKLEIPEEDRLRRAGVRRLAIPESSQLDRLLRYEASLDRAFDRALTQLLRLQHLRKSQKTIEVASQDVQVETQLIGRS